MLRVTFISNNSNSWSVLSSHFPNLLTLLNIICLIVLCKNMASMIPLQTIVPKNTRNPPVVAGRATVSNSSLPFAGSTSVSCSRIQKNKNRSSMVVSAVGDVSADSTIYLVAGAIAVALIGTAFPILFSRQDKCPECDGAGFVRKVGVTLRANAARKDEAQIVCARCNGLGKLNQIDKKI